MQQIETQSSRTRSQNVKWSQEEQDDLVIKCLTHKNATNKHSVDWSVVYPTLLKINITVQKTQQKSQGAKLAQIDEIKPRLKLKF